MRPWAPRRDRARAQAALPTRFWLYAAAALLYGIVETLCGNWATLYLTAERQLAARDASFALTAFWLMVTLGRVVFALLERWLPAKWVYVALPVVLAVVFQLVARADGAASGIAAFAAAGLACSALLPLSISLGGEEFPSRAATMSGELIAFYQVGYGVAAFGSRPDARVRRLRLFHGLLARRGRRAGARGRRLADREPSRPFRCEHASARPGRRGTR